MALYPYRMQLVVDPDNPRNVVAAGSVSIYDSEDTGMTTLLPLTDPSGVPIPNPITSNANGFTPPFVTTSPEVLWVSGPYTDYFQSYKGMRDEAVGAKQAAETAAANAGASAAADLAARIAAGEFKGEKGADGANVLPTEDAIAAAVNGNGPAKAALNATYAPKAIVDAIPATYATKVELSTAATPTPFEALVAGLSMGYEDIGMGLIGDSTGNAVDEWFYLLGTDLATRYPAYTVHHRAWNDTTQAFDRPAVIQTGAAGRRGILMATGATIASAGFAGPTITGDMDIRVNLKPASWRTGNQTIAAKFGASGDRSFRFQLQSSGNLAFDWSADGSVIQPTVNSGVTVPFADGAEGWVRVSFDVNNGASGNDVKFYTSTDGVTWTQLGTTKTTAGVASIFNSTTTYEIGARTGQSEPLTGGARIYEVEIRDGIDGPTIAPRLPTAWGWGVGTGTPVREGAPVLMLVNGSMPGAGIAYLGEATRVKKLTPDYSQAIQFVSDSHNEQNSIGTEWINKLSGFVASVRARVPLATPVLLTQNPRKSPAAYIDTHAIRRRQTMSWGKSNGYTVIDTYQAFLDSPAGLDVLVNVDGIHPTNSVGGGSSLWKNVILSLIPA